MYCNHHRCYRIVFACINISFLNVYGDTREQNNVEYSFGKSNLIAKIVRSSVFFINRHYSRCVYYSVCGVVSGNSDDSGSVEEESLAKLGSQIFVKTIAQSEKSWLTKEKKWKIETSFCLCQIFWDI